MKSDLLKKVIAAGALFALACTLGNAQSAPNASVDPNTGELILLDPAGNEISRIAKPSGDVVEGDLVIDGVTIPAPNGTVQTDGSLYLPDTDETLPVPQFPVALFFNNLYKYPNPEQAGWYYSNIINHFWDGASVGNSGWIFWEDWGMINQNNGWFYINTSVGSEEGFWSYSNFLNSWCYFWVGGDGFKRIANGADFQKGWFYVDTPPSGSNWYFYDQYSAEWAGGARVCLITNDNGANWIRLR